MGLSAFCLSCAAPQPVAPDADHFALLGLPRRLDLDVAELERRYHAAARLVHPDRHQTASADEQALSVAASAALNRAYRTLRDPVARGRYWLELHGDSLGAANNRVPPELAALVFEVQEQLAELRAGRGDAAAVAGVREALASRLADEVAALEREFAAHPTEHDAGVLAALKRRLSDIAYVRTLLRDVDAARGG
ncbi:MAG TPA: Fe-S protein assembly co-chaperone HscB [Candidatus Limnocylindria bacterium]|nr:Fe-S protein assembly co-chaperone HscB [Candidatus Limnocylindria bacterium]